jgi:energy-coupling factor transporter transmembrane protein EcfT
LSAANLFPERITVPLASVSFGELLLLVFEFFLLFAWIWILITVIFDLFRDHELSGVAKAVWVFFLVFLPFLGVLLYLIVRGGGMRDRALKEQADTKKHFDEYVREQAHAGSPAEELHKLNELKEKGALSQAEFDQAKAKLLGA